MVDHLPGAHPEILNLTRSESSAPKLNPLYGDTGRFLLETGASVQQVAEGKPSVSTLIKELGKVMPEIRRIAEDIGSNNPYFKHVIAACETLEWSSENVRTYDELQIVAYHIIQAIVLYAVVEHNSKSLNTRCDANALNAILEATEKAISVVESIPGGNIKRNEAVYISSMEKGKDEELNINLANRTFLVLDNDEDILEVQALRIEACNGNCLTSKTEEDSIENLGKFKVDVAIVDYNLGNSAPKGLESALAMKEASYRTKVILWTSDEFEEKEIRFLCRTGIIDGYVRKPANPLRAIAVLIGESSSQSRQQGE